MIKALLGSFRGKLASVGLLLAGIAGGFALTGGLPGLPGDVAPAASVQVDRSPPAAVALDFPTSVLQTVPAPAVPAPAVAQAVAVVEPAPVLVKVAAAPPPAPQCVGQVGGMVNGLLATVQGIVSFEQAQAVLAHASLIGQAAQGCAAEVTSADGLGLEELNRLATQLTGSVEQIHALAILHPAQPPAGTALDPAGGLLGLVGKGLTVTLNGVGEATELLGDGLGVVLSPGN